VPILPSILKETDIPARLAKSWSSSGAPTLAHGPASPPKAHASIAPARRTVTFVNSNRVAARLRSPARFRLICTKMPAMCPDSRLDTGIRSRLSPPKKGRDAVCTSQAHPSAWALAPARPVRRQRRIPPRGDGAELAEAREIETRARAIGSNAGVAWARRGRPIKIVVLLSPSKMRLAGSALLNRRVFQRYRRKCDDACLH
jgi:hypothetical protein